MKIAPIGIIGGSGLYQIEGVEITEKRHRQTPFGAPSDAIMLGKWADVPIAFLPRHGRGHRISPSEINYRANIWALKSLGVDAIISVSAVGSLQELVLIDQFIDRTKNRASTFFEDGLVAHVSFADPICSALHDLLYECRPAVACPVHEKGTYVCIEGPMFSTRAESLLYRSWGAQVIGMTNLQEAKLAREAEISYATIALATDYDCWRTDEAACETQSILEVLRANVTNAQLLISAALPLVAERTKNAAARCALDGAIMTAPHLVTDDVKRRLAPITSKYLDE